MKHIVAGVLMLMVLLGATAGLAVSQPQAGAAEHVSSDDDMSELPLRGF